MMYNSRQTNFTRMTYKLERSE